MKNINSWLRKEAEKLAVEAGKVEKKIIKVVEKRDYDKLNELNIQLRALNAQEHKLYELIGRLDKLDTLN